MQEIKIKLRKDLTMKQLNYISETYAPVVFNDGEPYLLIATRNETVMDLYDVILKSTIALTISELLLSQYNNKYHNTRRRKKNGTNSTRLG